MSFFRAIDGARKILWKSPQVRKHAKIKGETPSSVSALIKVLQRCASKIHVFILMPKVIYTQLWT